MPLRSRLLAGDVRLEDCAVRDQAHLTPGVQGAHVGKIQYALDLIDHLKIARQELIEQVYGPSTASAVLSFKQRRAIINRAYQTTPDNIVGRMTIAALDEEMLRIQRIFPAIGDCALAGVGGFVGRPSFGLAGNVGGPVKAPPQLGKKLRVIFGITKDTTGPFDLSLQIKAANKALSAFGMSLDVQSGTSTPDVLPTAQGVVIDDDIIEIRKASETLRTGLPNVLRVVIVKMPLSRFGETLRNKTVDGVTVKPFVFLNVKLRDVSDATLLHEMIHASHAQRQKHDDDQPSSIFFGDGTERQDAIRRTDLPEAHARELANAFFA